MRIIIITNIDTVEHVWAGKIYQPNEEYLISETDIKDVIADQKLYSDIVTKAQVSNGNIILTNKIEAWNWIKGDVPICANIENEAPFSAKFISVNGSIKKIYNRITGIQQQLAAGENTIIFSVPYNWCKIIGVEIVNGESLDKGNFYVLDTINGDYFGIPNAILNQFGSNVNIAKDFQQYNSSYDADLYIGMQLKIVYVSQSAKIIGINFDLHEVK